MESYYKGNSTLLFRLKGDFDQFFTLSEIEEMLPFERTAYVILMKNKLEIHEQNKKAQKNKKKR